jgi:ABC-type antimicrobial peptide transport system permease subunit
VGVVGDVRQHKLSEQPTFAIYLPYTQSPRPFLMISTALAVRTVSNPQSAINSIRAEIQVVDPDLPVSNLASMEYLIAESLSQPRFLTTLFSCFASLALLFSAVGLYSLMSYSVIERSREIGVRITLGARSEDIFRLVVKRGMILAFTGVSLGLALAFAITRVLSTFLFGTSSTDPFIFVFVPVFLISVGFVAIYIPASNAMRVDPIVVLKYE